MDEVIHPASVCVLAVLGTGCRLAVGHRVPRRLLESAGPSPARNPNPGLALLDARLKCAMSWCARSVGDAGPEGLPLKMVLPPLWYRVSKRVTELTFSLLCRVTGMVHAQRALFGHA